MKLTRNVQIKSHCKVSTGVPVVKQCKGYEEENNLVVLDSAVQSCHSYEQDEDAACNSSTNNRPTGYQQADFRICWHCNQNQANHLKRKHNIFSSADSSNALPFSVHCTVTIGTVVVNKLIWFTEHIPTMRLTLPAVKIDPEEMCIMYKCPRKLKNAYQ